VQTLELTELQLDSLTEIFNIGIGTAAASLSEMIDEDVQLAIPAVKCLPLMKASSSLAEDQTAVLSAVEQNFSGEFEGTAFLLFPKGESLELVRRLISSDLPLDELSEFEEDALKEVGNVILNACFYTISDMLGCRLDGDIPNHVQGSCQEILGRVDHCEDEKVVLMLSMTFSIPSGDINGEISYMMSVKSMQNFLHIIDAYLTQIAV